MNHPELMLVPVLMLSDHLLTVAGARARERGYSRHIRTEHYELNPVWQKEIARKRWLNPRHAGLVVAVTALLYAMDGSPLAGDDPALAFTSGVLLSAFGAINGRHLANLATFRRLQRHPEGDVDGVVTFSHEYVLRVSLYQHLPLLLPLALLCLCQPSPLLAGAVCGIVLLMLVHAAWIAAWRRRSTRGQPAKARAERASEASRSRCREG